MRWPGTVLNRPDYRFMIWITSGFTIGTAQFNGPWANWMGSSRYRAPARQRLLITTMPNSAQRKLG